MNAPGKTEHPFILLLTGPAGAGKSTVARAWASKQQRPSAHIPLDDVREFVKSGYAHPPDGWNEETGRQYRLARQGCATLASNFINAGFLCVIDDAIFPEWEEANYAGWQAALGDVPHYLVVLFPEFAYLVERNRHRTGNRLLSERMLRIIYEMMLPWRNQAIFPVIDNSELSIDETVARLEVEIERLRKRQASGDVGPC